VVLEQATKRLLAIEANLAVEASHQVGRAQAIVGSQAVGADQGDVMDLRSICSTVEDDGA
jgi:hypothetical protein